VLEHVERPDAHGSGEKKEARERRGDTPSLYARQASRALDAHREHCGDDQERQVVPHQSAAEPSRQW